MFFLKKFEFSSLFYCINSIIFVFYTSLMKTWLPITKKELRNRISDELDVILISGDAYVDHPSFGTAVIGRWIEYLGYKVAIVPQPNWQDDLRDFKKFGKPKYFFGVTAGNMDSMVNHYTAFKRLRSNDAYTPGGDAGFRPDYASVVYSKILKNIYPDVPVILGGVEASMRRLSHYDYWSDEVKSSILMDSGADMLVYGMGEEPISIILDKLSKGVDFKEITDVPSTAYVSKDISGLEDALFLPSHEECKSSKQTFAEAFKTFEINSNTLSDRVLVQETSGKYVVVNRAYNYSNQNIDAYYDLPYTRLPHPKYAKRGSVPAWEMIKNSVNIHRGCFGGCSFCAIAAHQGKFIQNRSEKSIINELKIIASMPDFGGHISDLGGPSANMYCMQGFDLEQCQTCKRASCIFPNICHNLNKSHENLNKLYEQASKVKGIKNITIGSGVRYDMLFPQLNQKGNNSYKLYVDRLLSNHVSGRLKVAPEHTEDSVLNLMRKTSIKNYNEFNQYFKAHNNRFGKRQQLIPYLISNHPGATENDMINMAIWLKENNIRPEQVQDFTPTPMTLSTTMYYCEFDPYTKKRLNVVKSIPKRRELHALFFYYKPESRRDITRILRRNGRESEAKLLFGR